MAPADAPSPQGGGGQPQDPSPNPITSSAASSATSTATSVGDTLAQALRDLTRGEQTASALEANLSALESKLDDILSSFGTLAEESNGAGPDVKENGDSRAKDGGQS